MVNFIGHIHIGIHKVGNLRFTAQTFAILDTVVIDN